MIKPLFALALGALMASATSLTPASAAIFSDTFDSYAAQLNWTPPSTVWNVSSGSVDLIGETTSGNSFDLFPGHGGYVDLDGTTNAPGTLQTAMSFLPGNYTLTFDLGGNARGDGAKTTVVSLGSFSKSITLDSTASYQPFSFSFSTTGGQLSFADLAGGNQNIGNILDNVTLASAVPEASTWAMMIFGFLGIGIMAYARKTSFRLV